MKELIKRIKQHMLRQELQELEWKLARLPVLAQSKVEYESDNKKCNPVKKMWNDMILGEVRPEYRMLTEQRFAIEARIHEIKEQLDNCS